MNDSRAAAMRLFFGVWPDPATREHIAVAASAADYGTGAQLVPRENYHLTLAFVGEVPVAHLAVLQQIGRESRGPGFALRFDAYEYWPKSQVVVVAAREIPSALREIWQRLHGNLAVHGLALNPKPLRPHTTLARKVSQAPVWTAMSEIAWTAREFSLVRSDTTGTRSAYTVVDTWSLLDETSKP
jgi:2'-5' RNA ligase